MVGIALFDLDGVVRHFPGRAAWPDVSRPLGPGAAPEVAAWSAACGEVNVAVLDVVRAVRQRARVGILTNGTSRLAADLATLGIAHEFDVIFNSAELGFAKPDVTVYEIVCARLGTDPSDVFFVDDSPAHVDVARDAGLRATLFVDAVLLSNSLGAVGLLGEGGADVCRVPKPHVESAIAGRSCVVDLFGPRSWHDAPYRAFPYHRTVASTLMAFSGPERY